MTKIRRSAKEWVRLVRAWRRSEQTAKQFATARGLSAASLSWWSWRLKRGDALVPCAPEVEFVPVRVTDDVGGQRGVEATVAWELTGPSGHVLRVYERMDAGALREALGIIERGGGHR
jgi:hypothetical protein